MPVYEFTALTGSGRKLKGVIDADSAAAAELVRPAARVAVAAAGAAGAAAVDVFEALVAAGAGSFGCNLSMLKEQRANHPPS